MPQVQLRFYEELNDFLPPALRKTTITHELTRRTSVKDLIESFGVPHTEIELILANDRSVDFSYIVQAGDRISVYPMFESLDISPLIRLREAPLRVPRFIIDANLGRLARYLRLLGFDSLYRNDYHDQEIADIAQRDRRIVLTRDRALLQHKSITHGYFVRSDKPREQVKEILARLDLYNSAHPFTRCMRCNGEIENVDKESVDHQLQPKTRQFYDRFRRCKDCGQAYWRGSHFERMERLCEEFLSSNNRGQSKNSKSPNGRAHWDKR
ncbi:MAG: Mut7-C ubiquitin/RNAse domain-containing protein [Gammaproteobacteria bacterium]|nr:Mut7-C ubiquitin/RNAse domain-containing protein [Gammaproteobacteria bacterium]